MRTNVQSRQELQPRAPRPPSLHSSEDLVNAPPTPLQQHRFHLLDGLRGLAAVVVVLVHAPTALRLRPEYGTLAVDFFFCLSGFVIAFSYESRLEHGLRPPQFLLVRFVRLYPLYALGTFLMLLRTPLSSERWQYLEHTPWKFAGLFLLAMLAVPNFWTTAPGVDELYPFNSPAWSVLYEVAANFAYAALAFVRWLDVVFPLLGTAAFAYLVHRAWTGLSLSGGVRADGAAVACARIAFSYTAGIYLHRLFRHTSWRPSAALGTTLALGLGVLLPLALCAPPMAHEPLYQLFVITVFCPLVVFAGSLIRASQVLTKLCVVLGTISYPLYMLHPFFGLGEHNARLAALMLTHPALARGLYLTSLLVAVGVSWLAARYFDEPVRRRLSMHLKVRRPVPVHDLLEPTARSSA